MKPGALVTAAVVLILVAAVFISRQDPVEEADVDEVRARIVDSRPEWANYLEDLKGQIGSTPVARWRGSIVSANATEGAVRVEFTLSEFWLEHQLAIPMLIRDNLGNVVAQSGYEFAGDALSYTFALNEQASRPWVEIKYPNAIRRIVFDSDGHWTAPDAE